MLHKYIPLVVYNEDGERVIIGDAVMEIDGDNIVAKGNVTDEAYMDRLFSGSLNEFSIGPFVGKEQMADTPPTFVEDLARLINKHSLENMSDTPDFILAAYLQNCLVDYAHSVKARDRWYGENLKKES